MSDTAGITLSLTDEPRRRSAEPAARPQLILALECSRPTVLSVRFDLSDVHLVTFGRGSQRSVQRSGHESAPGDQQNLNVPGQLDIRVPDRWMSSRHARLEHSFGRWMLTDTNSKNGVFVNGEPVQRVTLQDGALIELGHTFLLFRDTLPTPPGLDGYEPNLDYAATPPTIPGMATLLPEFAYHLQQLGRIAQAPIPVLLQGPSGSGKEVVARAIHTLSQRRGDMVAVNCGAIPSNLVESELFGHKKGSFSGAIDDRVGLVRSADGGTLFLDEIGDLPAPSQAALLRVLQECEVTPVGGTRPLSVDLRVVAATHQDLDALIDTGGFRQDLFARLAGFRLRLPSLAERREDLGLLIGLLFGKIDGAADHPGFDCDAVRLMFDYDWPLNIRELEQTLTTAAVLSAGETIAVEHLPTALRSGRGRAATGSGLSGRADSVPDSDRASSQPPESAADEERRKQLLGHLRAHRGNVSAVARAMGKDRKQIQRWLKRYKLLANDFRR